MAYTFDQIFAADPSNPDQIAANGVVTIFAPGDETQTPLTITTVDGLPLQNPIAVNEVGYGPAFMHATLDRVAWAGGGLSGFLTSYDGMKNEAVAARQEAGAAASAALSVQARAEAGEFDGAEGPVGEQGEQGLPGVNALPTATAVAEYVRLPGPVKEALKEYAPDNGGKPVGKGELVINAKDYGAKGDDRADDTAAIIAAEAAAMARGGDATLLMPVGVYRTTSKIKFRCNLNASEATIRYYGTDVAVVVGDDSAPGIVTARREFRLPRVINANRGTTGWDGTSVGIKGVNLNTCQLHVPFVQDFETGLWMYGYGAGNTYNTVTLGALWDNHVNLKLSHTDTNTTNGYCNQNTFIGGRLNQTLAKGAKIGDPNAFQISMLGVDGNLGPNNNVFLNVSVESNGVAHYALDISGRYNAFYNCRWEVPGGYAPSVRYRASAQYNKIDGGYNAEKLIEVFEGTLGGGAIFDHIGAYAAATASGVGQVIPNASWTAVNSWKTPLSRRVAYDVVTGEFKPRPGRWSITASIAFASAPTGRRIVRLVAGGATLDICEVPGSAGLHSMKLLGSALFDGTKIFKVEAYQSSGNDLALATDSPYVKITAEYLGY